MMHTNRTVLNVFTICAGNAMEWYDFMIYNFMLFFIAHAFFLSSHPITSLLFSMLSSGIALVVRPLGGVILGGWADRHGHEKALFLNFCMMGFATCLITFTPDYAVLGHLATSLIILARLLQGIATGGEFGISSSLLVSLAPVNQRGFYASFQMVGQLFALLLGSVVCLFVTTFCSEYMLYQYAWRLPFVLGLLIIPLGLVLRKQLINQSKKQMAAPASKPSPLNVLEYKSELFIAFGLVVGSTSSIYTVFSYMPIFSQLYLNLSLPEAYLGVLVGLVICTFFTPIFGMLSDKVGKRVILISSLLLYCVVSYPLLSFLQQHPSFIHLVWVESILGGLMGAYFGVLTLIVTELFPHPLRATCLSISYNLAVMLFGGFAPLIITYFIEKTHNPMFFAYYLMLGIMISLLAAMGYQEKSAFKMSALQDKLPA